MFSFSLFSPPSFFLCLPTAIFLLDNRLEVYLWQGNEAEDDNRSTSACSTWDNERRCAMQTVLQYCKGEWDKVPGVTYRWTGDRLPSLYRPFLERDLKVRSVVAQIA